MTTPPVGALRPLAQTLLCAARSDADVVVGRARADAARLLADARREAAGILAEARRQGEADAAAVQAADRAAARREAREDSLRVRRDIYEELRDRCRAAAVDRTPQSLRSALIQAVQRILGDGAIVRDADGGGIVGEAAGRRLDLSTARFIDLAFTELGWQVFDGAPAAVPQAAHAPGDTP